MSVYDLKPRFQNLLRPISEMLAAKGVTANQVTLSAVLLSMVTGIFVLIRSESNSTVFLILPIVLFIRMALNAIDGMLAREHSMKSKLGAVLNEAGDVVSDVFLYASFLYYCSPLLLGAALFLGVLSEYIGVVGVMTGSGRRYEGPMGKSDRAVAFGVLALLLAFEPLSPNIVNWILIIISLCLIRTCQNRVLAAIAP